MKFKPRWYQEESKDAFFDYYKNGNIGNPLIALPTGTGKSLVNTMIIEEIITRYPNQRILCLTHVKELIEQNYKALIGHWPTAPAGIYSAGVGRKDVGYPITFAGIQSIHKKANVFQRTDVIIVDEAHLVSPKGGTMYQKFISDLKRYNPYLIVVGMSATPFRIGQGELTKNGLFTDVCYDMTTMEKFNQLVDEGYIASLIPLRTKNELDIDGLRTVSGEFNIQQMQERYNVDSITRVALEESIVSGFHRNHWLIFATGIEHCERIAKMLTEVYGVECKSVHSKIPKDERENILNEFKNGKLKAVVNNNVLTVGFDYPAIDLIIVLRPTNSAQLWVQMMGRGTRPVWPSRARAEPCNWNLWPTNSIEQGRYDLDTIEGRMLCIKEGPKPNCLVMDFAANTKRLGPINDPVIPKPPKKGKRKGEAPIKICDNCGMYNHASVRICKACGYEFPVAVKIKSNASDHELIRREDTVQKPIVIEVVKVTGREFAIHQKKDMPPSLKITFACGFNLFTLYLGLEHKEPFAKQSRDLWRLMSGSNDVEVPSNTETAYRLAIEELRTPLYLRVRFDTEYPQILDYDFTGDDFGREFEALNA
jgi:DNA repair protein RadD